LLDDLKVLLGESDKDELLSLLIRKATNEVLDYCNLDELPSSLNDVVVDIAVIKYNRMGSEGALNESFEGISTTYETDLPISIRRKLNQNRRLFR
jgi:hypothetical protein